MKLLDVEMAYEPPKKAKSPKVLSDQQISQIEQLVEDRT
jgi:hypothetical protein